MEDTVSFRQAVEFFLPDGALQSQESRGAPALGCKSAVREISLPLEMGWSLCRKFCLAFFGVMSDSQARCWSVEMGAWGAGASEVSLSPAGGPFAPNPALTAPPLEEPNQMAGVGASLAPLNLSFLACQMGSKNTYPQAFCEALRREFR